MANCTLYFDGLAIAGIAQNGELIDGRETKHAVPCDTDTANFIYRFGAEVEIRDGQAYVKRSEATDALKNQNQWLVPFYLRDEFHIVGR